ncbi:DUF1631 family protein [Curvibacter sp. HBC61]|uniref:DUF1631 family protein n=1 Tax=Curvibacter cyanobacteriorum TaxID=3026422 RepID=A0ABT5N2V2_9BURK|nr:DUF1631 family protein [Curvibacter sp. HBC61]MDD0839378.1 DUF1631 family protein [Curvibacter sp. HBC61]
MATYAAPTPPHELGLQVRQRFVDVLLKGLPALAEASDTQMLALASQTGTAREMQAHRDAWLAWQQKRGVFLTQLRHAWQGALKPAAASPAPRAGQLDVLSLELVGDDVVENKIMSSRMASALSERVALEWGELRGRLQELQAGEDLPANDVLRVETLTQLLVEQWVQCELSRDSLLVLFERLKGLMAAQLREAYRGASDWLTQRGVVANDDLRARVKRAPSSLGFDSGSQSATLQSTGQDLASTRSGLSSRSARAEDTRLLTATTPLLRARARAHGLIGQLQRLLLRSVGEVGGSLAGDSTVRSPVASPSARAGLSGGAPIAAGTPTGVAGGLGLSGLQFSAPASEALAQALAAAPLQHQRQDGAPLSGVLVLDASAAGVAAAVGAVREKSAELKKKTANPAEKATIEIVALMFQSILSEERLPPTIRVWFARLQVPVLRVALAEPEFFENLSHPARLLIDRMGSCVLGFDDNAIADSALEAEIRRVVQVIEQYPETGRRVFQLVHDEFQRFLDRFLTEKSKTSRLVSVAQQVEQKEALGIQYTIELRNMLKDMPVRDEVRDFLFKVWSEVLALSAVRSGPQHDTTVLFKKTAADLVWAASAKPNRADRARVIHDLPMLLQRLRQGLSLLGVNGSAQEAHIKILSETLADAFLSKTEAIPQATIDAMAKRLTHLEDYVTEEGLDELPLDAESLEVMLGVDSTSLTVVAGGGSQPSEDMLAWALELQPGLWFTLDHNGSTTQVQYAWRSDRRQLHLFASLDGGSYLIQLRRLAAYLQAGLLVPQEEETLTLRATREALAKLDANPERLLN